MTQECFKVDAALKKAIAAAKSRGFDPEVELSPQEYAAHMRRWVRSRKHPICLLRWIDGYFKKLAKHPTYVAAVAGCKHEEFMVPVEDGEGGQVSPSLICICVCICTCEDAMIVVFSGACAGPHPGPPCHWREESGSGLRAWWSRPLWNCKPLQAPPLPPRHQL